MTTKPWTTALLLALLPLAASTASAEPPSAEARGLEIAKAVDRANAGFGTESSAMQMTLINAHGETVERKLAIQTIEGEDDGDKSVAAFSWPADVNGTKLLTWSHKSDDDDQWLYLPAIKRIKRISARNKSGAFMGSEFAYEDLGSQEVEKFTYRFVREDEIDGRKVWVNERRPTDERSGYKRQVVYTDQEYMNPLRIEYFDRKDELLKTGEFSGYTKQGKWWRVGKIDMFNAQTKKRSILTWSKRTLGVELDEDDFESDALSD